ncbi:MAG TPA: hypothetical protein VIN09_13920 [Chloroflexota bacterium]
MQEMTSRARSAVDALEEALIAARDAIVRLDYLRLPHGEDEREAVQEALLAVNRGEGALQELRALLDQIERALPEEPEPFERH